MLILIVILPLLGFFSSILFGPYVFVEEITIYFLWVSFILCCFFFGKILICGYDNVIVNIGCWINITPLKVTWSLYFDSITLIMYFVITFVSTSVHAYSAAYMGEDPHFERFFSYISLFTFFMYILVFANNFLQLFVGWEGVGLSSFLLINFWFTRIQANKAAIKAMLINRVGDFAMLIAIFLIYICFGSLNYSVVFSLVSQINYNLLNIGSFTFSILDCICILLFIGAMGKSAQLGLHIWLPDAMEGPTPVSALIHSATMVTAGVFLIVRCSFIFEFSPLALTIIILIGSLTAFGAATIGLFQNDIKKVIAYSTCSQLGYMIFACGLSSYHAAFFHLFTHAYFKAMLFLTAGSIIHATNDEQDMRKMGGLQKLLPLCYVFMLIGSLSLMGIPFLSGFYSKDLILELAYSKYTVIAHTAYVLGILAAFCTAFYSVRLIFLVFLSKPNGNWIDIWYARESSDGFEVPILVLFLFTLSIGWFIKTGFFNTFFFENQIFVLPSNYIVIDSEFILFRYKVFPLIITLLGAFSAFIIYLKGLHSFYFLKLNNLKFKLYYIGINKKWFFDRIYVEFIGQNFLNLAYSFSYQNIDRGFLEQFGPIGIIRIFNNYSKKFINIQNGSIFHYSAILLFSLFVFFLFIYYI